MSTAHDKPALGGRHELDLYYRSSAITVRHHQITQDFIKFIGEHEPGNAIIGRTNLAGHFAMSRTYCRARGYAQEYHRAHKNQTIEVKQ